MTASSSTTTACASETVAVGQFESIQSQLQLVLRLLEEAPSARDTEKDMVALMDMEQWLYLSQLFTRDALQAVGLGSCSDLSARLAAGLSALKSP